MIARRVLAFPKPKDAPRKPMEAFKTLDDGREICFNVGLVKQSLKGRNEYRSRIEQMAERQNQRFCLEGFCPICPGSLIGYRPTFEHENGRGGKRDDRIQLPDGRWINGAAHLECNAWKGSRRIDYNTSIQARAEKLI